MFVYMYSYIYIYINVSQCDDTLFNLPYFYVSNSALLFWKIILYSLLHRRNLDTFYIYILGPWLFQCDRFKKTYMYTHTYTQQPSWFNKNGATKCVHDAENIFQNVNPVTLYLLLINAIWIVIFAKLHCIVSYCLTYHFKHQSKRQYSKNRGLSTC